jgi:hypothetical protein
MYVNGFDAFSFTETLIVIPFKIRFVQVLWKALSVPLNYSGFQLIRLRKKTISGEDAGLPDGLISNQKSKFG